MIVIGKYVCVNCEKEITVEETHLTEGAAKKCGATPGDIQEFGTYCSDECREEHYGKLGKEAAKRSKRRDSRKKSKSRDAGEVQAKTEDA